MRERLDNPKRLAFDFAVLMVALALFALAMVLSLQSDLGASSWTVFHHGISLQTPLTLGTAGIIVGLLILVSSWAMGIKPGIGTLANMLFIGIWTDVYLEFELIPKAAWLPAQLAMLVGGVVLLGFATALYIKTGFGAGPRDAFMLALTRRTNIRVGIIRWAMEITVVVIGILLGGSFGIGTLIFAALIGPSVDFFFNIFGIRTRAGDTQRARRLSRLRRAQAE
ncbi:MAG TPA: membrane protein [Thermomicrobiales bacterium]|nr:membrane protein [Thermomicrobiales bacterium]